MISVYITFPDEDSAVKMAELLLEKQLIACANILSGRSLYRWEGEIKNEEELVMIVKTTEEKWGDLQRAVSMAHPYEIPCIVKYPVEANLPYEKWVRSEL